MKEANKKYFTSPLVNKINFYQTYYHECMGTTFYDVPGSYTWTVPGAASIVTIECWGGGGAGGGSGTATYGGGGGGGGAYATRTVTLTPGNTYSVIVGGGGVSGINSALGGDSSIFASGDPSNEVVAVGGYAGSINSAVNNPPEGDGGPAAACNPITGAFSGGDGADQGASSGGGGGGGAGDSQDGFDSPGGTTPGNGGVSGGGTGGVGGFLKPGGDPGNPYGGGGGGASLTSNQVGGNGGDGAVLITCDGCGGAGDPHFVGFDGIKFDFHGKPNSWYNLYQDDIVCVTSKFIKYNHPAHVNDTFMGEVHVTFGGETTIITKEDHKKSFPYAKNIKSRKRNDALPRSLNSIGGDITDAWYFRLPHGNIVVSRTVCGPIVHLNVSLDLFSKMATGIIGQTLNKNRLPNENFELFTPC